MSFIMGPTCMSLVKACFHTVVMIATDIRHVGYRSFPVRCKGLFPLLRNFNVILNFTRVNKIESMHGRSRVNAKVERSTFTFTGSLSYITSILFTRVRR